MPYLTAEAMVVGFSDVYGIPIVSQQCRVHPDRKDAEMQLRIFEETYLNDPEFTVAVKSVPGRTTVTATNQKLGILAQMIMEESNEKTEAKDGTEDSSKEEAKAGE